MTDRQMRLSVYRDWCRSVLAMTDGDPLKMWDLWSKIPQDIRIQAEIDWMDNLCRVCEEPTCFGDWTHFEGMEPFEKMESKNLEAEDLNFQHV